MNLHNLARPDVANTVFSPNGVANIDAVVPDVHQGMLNTHIVFSELQDNVTNSHTTSIAS